MPRTILALAFLAGGLFLAGHSVAQPKKYACSLLTGAEVGAFAGGEVGQSMSHDEVLARGPFKGQRQERCNWPLGPGGRAGNVYLNVSPTGAAGQGKANALLDDMGEQLEKQGWSVQKKTVAGVACLVATSPPAQKAAAVSCVAEAKGRALSVASVGPGSRPSAEKVKSLLDTAARRLP